MVHGALAIPDRTDRDEVVVTREEIAASGLDYLALGHWHSAQQGKAGVDDLRLLRARPSPSPSTRTAPARSSLVALDEADGARTRHGRGAGGRADAVREARHRRGDARGPAGPRRRSSRRRADPDLVLDVRLTGVRPDELDVSTDEVEDQLKGSFLKLRVRDAVRCRP